MSAPARPAPAVGTQWRLTIPTPAAGWSSMNDRSHWVRHKRVKAWREATLAALQVARVPRGVRGPVVQRVRVDVVCRFTDDRDRDRANYQATAKPIVDTLIPTKMRPGKEPVVGWGLIPDDNDAHLDGPVVTIGDPVGRTLARPLGYVEVIVTVLDPTP